MDKHQRKARQLSKAHTRIILILVLIALFNLGWLGFRSVSAYFTKQKYTSATGIVVDITRQKASGSAETEHHYAVVEFQTPDGRTVIFKDNAGSPEPKYQPGEVVPVLYNKEKPYIALVDPQEQN